MVTDVLGSKTLCRVEDLEDARNTVKNMSTTRQALADFIRKNPNIKHVEVLQFDFLSAAYY